MVPCPTPETLGQLACNASVNTQFTALEAHVQTCALCQEVLERVVAVDPLSEGHGPRRSEEPERHLNIPGFVIEGVVGRGGMAVVYQAWQPQLAHRVAIEVASASAGIGAEDRRRWLREARAIGRVRHRNIVQIYQAGEQDGFLYLVLDLIAGVAWLIAPPARCRRASPPGRWLRSRGQSMKSIEPGCCIYLDSGDTMRNCPSQNE
jgi:hypothetical protein